MDHLKLCKSIVLSLIMLFSLSATCWCGNVFTGDISELTDVSKLIYLRDSICTQTSSFDPTGGNDDGFSGKTSFLRMENGKQVIFDSDGPGCIYRFWSAMPFDQKIEFYFDGSDKPGLVFDNWKDMFQDKVFPFMKPLSQHFIGGWCSYVPIPFTKHCKVLAYGKTQFYQVTWQKFASAEGIKTFSTNFSDEYKAKFEAVKKVWDNPGMAPWGDKAPAGLQEKSVNASIKPGSKQEILQLSGTGIIRSLHFTFDCDDPRYFRKCILEISTDGSAKPNVWTPVGDFFLDGFGWPQGKSMMVGTDSTGKYYSYWPMPYAKGISIRLINDAGKSLKFTCQAQYESMDKLPQDTGRFYAWWHRENLTTVGKGFEMLTAKGRGHFCGVNHFMQGPHDGVSYLEGDEMMWIDNRDNTFYNGTGTEDYFNGGWYFGATGSAPFYGCLALNGPCVDAYRLQITDLVPFQQKAHIEIEHGSKKDYPVDYAGVTYFYGEPNLEHTFNPVPVDGRILRPRFNRQSVEAERTFQGGGPYVVIEYQKGRQLEYSDGSAVNCYADKPGGTVMCKFNAEATSEYAVQAQVVCGPDFGKAIAFIDGKQVGKTVDCYSPDVALRVMNFADRTHEIHASGDHIITFKVIGKSDKSKSYRFGLDTIYLSRIGLIEGEKLKLVEATNGTTEVQRMGGITTDWSNNEQLLLNGEKGSTFTFNMFVGKTGRYNIGAYTMLGPKCGNFDLYIDGMRIGEGINSYNTELKCSEMMRFGNEYNYTAGNHILKIVFNEKDAQSKGYLVGLDAISLERVPNTK